MERQSVMQPRAALRLRREPDVLVVSNGEQRAGVGTQGAGERGNSVWDGAWGQRRVFGDESLAWSQW